MLAAAATTLSKQPESPFNEMELAELILKAEKEKLTAFYPDQQRSTSKEAEALWIKLENQIAKNRRELNVSDFIEEMKKECVFRTKERQKRAGPLKPQFQYQHQRQAAQQVQVQAQVQQQTQAQQQIQQSHQSKGMSGKVPALQCLTLENFILSEKFRKQCLNAGIRNLMLFWDYLFGFFAEYVRYSVRYLTAESADEILKFHYYFLDGFDYDELPDGFFIQPIETDEKDENPGFVLCFDRKRLTLSSTPLRVRLLPPYKAHRLYGDGRQFLQKDGKEQGAPGIDWTMPLANFNQLGAEDAKKYFIAYMQAENPMLANKFLRNPIFKGWSRLQNYNALLPILMARGCHGIEKFLALLNKIPQEYQHNFQLAFLDLHNDWSYFLETEESNAFELFKGWTPNQWAWWNYMTEKQARSAGPLHFADLLQGFNYFFKEYTTIVGETDLPERCPFKNVGNMKVLLSRYLGILKRSTNPKQQAKDLDEIDDFSSMGPYHAMRRNKFVRVLEPMKLTTHLEAKPRYWISHEKSFLGKPLPGSQDEEPRGSVSVPNRAYADVSINGKYYQYNPETAELTPGIASTTYPTDLISYSVDSQELSKIASDTVEDGKRIESTIMKCYRFLGKQEQVASIADYEKALQYIKTNGDGLYDLSFSTKERLIVFLTFCSVGDKGSKSSCEESIKKLLEINLPPFISKILLSWKNCSLDELVAIATFLKEEYSRHTRLKVDQHVNNLNQSFIQYSQKYPIYFLPALKILASYTENRGFFLEEIKEVDQALGSKIADQFCILLAIMNNQTGSDAFISELKKTNPELINDLLKIVLDCDYEQARLKELSWDTLTTSISSLEKEEKNGKEKKEKEKKDSVSSDKILKQWQAWFPPLNKPFSSHDKLDTSLMKKFGVFDEATVKKFEQKETASLSPMEKWCYQYASYYREEKSSPISSIFKKISEINQQYLNTGDELLPHLKNNELIRQYCPLLLNSILDALDSIGIQSNRKIFPISFLKLFAELDLDKLPEARQIKLAPIIKSILEEQSSIFNKQQKIVLLTMVIKKTQMDTDTLTDFVNMALLLKKEHQIEGVVPILPYCPSINELDQTMRLLAWASIKGSCLEDCQYFLKVAEKEGAHYPAVLQAILSGKDPLKRKMIIKIAAHWGLSPDLPGLINRFYEAEPDQLLTILNLAELGFLKADLLTNQPRSNWPDIIYKAQTIPDRKKVALPLGQEQRKKLIHAIINHAPGEKRLRHMKQRKILKWLNFIDLIGKEKGVLRRQNGTVVPVKNLTHEEMLHLIAGCKTTLNSDATNKEKTKAKLLFLALARELMFRTNKTYANEAQLICVLNSWLENNNVFTKLLAGEGKTLVLALVHAMDCLMGKPVDIATQNANLATEGLEDNARFFKALRIPVTYITSQSTYEEYENSQIRYGDIGEMILFWEKMQLQGHVRPANTVLALDEADYILQDNYQMIYRYVDNEETSSATGSDASVNPYEWLYPLINDCVDRMNIPSDEMIDDEDIAALRYDLLNQVKESKDFVKKREMINGYSIEFLKTLLNDALMALSVTENQGYVIQDDARTIDEETFAIKIARVMEEKTGRVSAKAEFTGHVQPFLHARKNAQYKGRFPIDAVVKPQASLDSRCFVESYKTVAAYSGTWEKEADRVKQLVSTYPARLFSMPSYNKDGLDEKDPIIVDSLEKEQSTFLRETRTALADPGESHVVIILKTIDEAKALFDLFEQARNEKRLSCKGLQLCHANTIKLSDEKEKPWDLATEKRLTREKAGLNKMVTITTSMLTRGVDIKIPQNDEKKEPPKNKRYVLTNEADDERTLQQALRRASRYGKDGQGQLIVQRSKLKPPLRGEQEAKTSQERVLQHQATMAYLNDFDRTLAEQGVQVHKYFFDLFLQLKRSFVGPIANDKSLLLLRKEHLLSPWENYLYELELAWREVIEKHAAIKKNGAEDEKQAFEQKLAADTQQYIEMAVAHWDKNIARLQKELLSAGHQLVYENNQYQIKKTFKPKEKMLDLKEAMPGKSLCLDLTLTKQVILKKPESLKPDLLPLADEKRSLSRVEFNDDELYCDLLLDVTGGLNLEAQKKNLIYVKLNKLIRDLNLDVKGDLITQFQDMLREALVRLLDRNPMTFKTNFIRIAEIISESQVESLKFEALKVYKQFFDTMVLNAIEVPGVHVAKLRADVYNLLKSSLDQKQDQTEFNETKRQIIALLKSYNMNKWRRWIAKDRSQNVDRLITSINACEDFNSLFKALQGSRNDAMTIDYLRDKEAWFFKRNRKGSRYQNTLNQIWEVALNASARQFDHVHHFNDWQAIVFYLANRVQDEHLRSPRHAGYQALYDILSSINLKINVDYDFQTEYSKIGALLGKLNVLPQVQIARCDREIQHLYHAVIKKSNSVVQAAEQSGRGKKILDRIVIKKKVIKAVQDAKGAEDYKDHKEERLRTEIYDTLRYNEDRIKIRQIKVAGDTVTFKQIDEDLKEEKEARQAIQFSL